MISKIKYIFISFIIFTFIFISNSNSIEPDVFVQSTVNRASQVLSNNLSKEQKIEELKNLTEKFKELKSLVYDYKEQKDNEISNLNEEQKKLKNQLEDNKLDYEKNSIW